MAPPWRETWPGISQAQFTPARWQVLLEPAVFQFWKEKAEHTHINMVCCCLGLAEQYIISSTCAVLVTFISVLSVGHTQYCHCFVLDVLLTSLTCFTGIIDGVTWSLWQCLLISLNTLQNTWWLRKETNWVDSPDHFYIKVSSPGRCSSSFFCRNVSHFLCSKILQVKPHPTGHKAGLLIWLGLRTFAAQRNNTVTRKFLSRRTEWAVLINFVFTGENTLEYILQN